MRSSILLHRFKLFLLSILVVVRYSLYFFRVNTLKWRFADEDERLDRLHARNARVFATFAAGSRGALIKLGQFISARADVMPPAVVREMSRLQDQVIPAPLSEVHQILREELGRPWEEVYASFAEVPLGAASLGQVHEAHLRDGRRVAVKIQYRNIREFLERDFRTLLWTLRKLQPFMKHLYFLPLFEEFRRAVMEEIDYRQEARNGRRLREALAGVKRLRMPEVYDEFSTDKVLTMSFVEGYKIVDVERMKAMGLEPEKVMARVVELYSEQLFVHGFFQSDPHPGNLFFDKDESGQVVIGLVDFGQAKDVPQQVHRTVLKAVGALLAGDVDGCTAALVNLGFMAEKDQPRLAAQVQKLADRLGPAFMMGLFSGGNKGSTAGTGAAEEFGGLRKELDSFLKETDGLKIPHDVVLYGRVLSLLYGLAARIAPGFKVFEALLPYMARALKGIRAS